MLSKDPNLKLLNNTIKHALKFAQHNKIICEVSANIHIGLSVNIRMQNIDTLEFNNDQRLGVTVYIDNKHGFSQGSVVITELNKAAIENAIIKAQSIATFTNADPYAGLADANLMAKTFIDLDLYHPKKINADFAINLAKQCEQAALDFDKKITNTDGTLFNYNTNFQAIGNSNDFIASTATTSYSLSCATIAEHDKEMQRDYDFTVARCISDLIDYNKIGRQAASYTINRLGARKIATCNTKILFTPRVAVNFFGYLIAAINGDNIANKSSFLLNNLHGKIFPDFINIIDDPFIKRGLASSTFDSDGLATKKQNIITNGVLSTYLLDVYFARKLNLTPTGHANGIHNLLIQANQNILSYDDLIKTMHTGLIVTETIGHGVNLVTGDYSKGAFGFWVENGKIAYPVEEITIAGNLKNMFNNILAVGSDVNYQDNIITGSVLIDNITVAGE